MTEEHWLTCTDPLAMLEFLGNNTKVSDRKRRLFCCACCRALWPLLCDKPYRQAVEVGERFCDGLASPAELVAACAVAEQVAWVGGGPLWCAGWYVDPAGGACATATHTDAPAVLALAAAMADTQVAAQFCVWWATALGAEPALQAGFLRDIMHAPFRAVFIQTAWQRWNDGLVVKLAQAACDDRLLPSGHLDAARLAILADALEEAGCTDADLLGHLKQQGPHVRGCWVVDAVLGR